MEKMALEIISEKTPREISKTTDVANADEISHLGRDINDLMTKLVAQHNRWLGRVDTELLPLLYRMRGLLPHGQWGAWYKAFCTHWRITMTMRTVQRKFAELEAGWNGSPSPSRSPSPTPELPEATLLAQAKEQFGASAAAGNEQAAGIIAQYQADYEAAKARKDTERPAIDHGKLVSIVEIGEQYIRVLERIVFSATVALSENQRNALQKPLEAWRKVLRDVRGMKAESTEGNAA